MEIGIFSRTYEISDLEETCRRMAAQGISHTQFNLSNAGLPTLPDAFEEKKIEEIKKVTEEYKITLDAISGTFNMIDSDEDERKKGCMQFKNQCRIAGILGIPIISLCTGSKDPKNKWKWHDDNDKLTSWDDLLRSTEEILKYAEDDHIVLGVETETANIINTPQKARKYLDAFGSSNLKIIMDGANLFLPEQIKDMDHVLEEAFELLGKDIVLAHAKDFSFEENMKFVAAGEGLLDYQKYMKLLKQYDYKGALIMHGLSEAQVPKSKRFLEEMAESCMNS